MLYMLTTNKILIKDIPLAQQKYLSALATLDDTHGTTPRSFEPNPTYYYLQAIHSTLHSCLLKFLSLLLKLGTIMTKIKH